MRQKEIIRVEFARANYMAELKALVEDYFEKNNLVPTGGPALHIKAVIIGTLYIITYIGIISFQVPAFITLILYAFHGFLSALVGFNIMHDAAHGSFSSKKNINTALRYTADILGGSWFIWNPKHNILHHPYTNIEGHDEDFEIPFMNILKKYLPKKYHRYQHRYAHFLYLLTSLSTHFGDYRKYFNGINGRGWEKVKLYEHIIFWVFKAIYTFMYLVLPIYLNGWLIGIGGFFVMHFVFGYIMAIVFQLAHLVPKTKFVEIDEKNRKVINVEDEWVIHQLNTTCDFAHKNKVISWLVGGLNFQTEHHLFVKISHIHYPVIAKIVKDFTQKHSLQYNEYETLEEAVNAHFSFLKVEIV